MVMQKHIEHQFTKYLQSNLSKYPEKIISRKEIIKLCTKHNYPVPSWLTYASNRADKRGFYKIPEWVFGDAAQDKKIVVETKEVVPDKSSVVEMSRSSEEHLLEDNVIPIVDKNYVEFGCFDDLYKIINSKVFYPVYVAGLSGNGKTFMVEQICAKLKRPMVRVNITKETDEDDLLGGFRLVNGETKFCPGPVIRAMQTGALLLIDEVHLAQMSIMCLQPVLEGKGVFIKKLNKFIMPATGFNIVATANTKGKFSESGSFAGANIQDEAFLDRFAITIEQEYPSAAIEKKILKNVFSEYGIEDDDFVEKLAIFANNSRKLFEGGGIDEVISTRRLVHIAKAFAIFGDKTKAIEYCTNRFDSSVKNHLRMFWDKLFVKEEVVQPVAVESINYVDTQVSF